MIKNLMSLEEIVNEKTFSLVMESGSDAIDAYNALGKMSNHVLEIIKKAHEERQNAIQKSEEKPEDMTCNE